MNRKALTAISLLLALIMLAACAAPAAPTAPAAPGQAEAPAAQQGQAQADPATPEAPTLEPGQLPIVTEPLTLTMWAKLGRSAISLTSFSEMLAYQELQNRTGITLEFLHPPVGGETESFNLLIASRDFPDLIEHNWGTLPGGPGLFIGDGVIIPLCDYVDFMPNLFEWYADIPEALTQNVMDDGTHYMFPNLFVDPELQHAGGPIIRYDWLNYLGVDEPITIQDWYELLTLVRDSEIDGHTDLIPFTLQGAADFNNFHLFVGAWGITTRWTNENGRIVFGPSDPRFREFLETMHDWYNKGLLDNEFASNVARDLDELVMGDRVFAFPGFMGTAITRYTQAMRATNPDFTLMAQYYPVHNRGERPLLGNRSFIATGGGTAITTANQHVIESVLLMDYNFSWDGMLLGNFGVEGVTFNLVDGIPVYTDLILDHPDGLDIATAISKYTFHSGDSALPKPNWVVNQRDSLPEQLSGRLRWMHTLNDLLTPRLLPTLEESHEFQHLMNTINAFVDESLVNFIMGRTPLDEFDSFVNTLEGMGVARAQEIMQAQLDRYALRP